MSLAGTAALEEDAQILKVIEAYCTSAKTRQTLNSSKCHRSPLPLCWFLLPKITPRRTWLGPVQALTPSEAASVARPASPRPEKGSQRSVTRPRWEALEWRALPGCGVSGAWRGRLVLRHRNALSVQLVKLLKPLVWKWGFFYFFEGRVS